jgi:hypothetical protein
MMTLHCLKTGWEPGFRIIDGVDEEEGVLKGFQAMGM